MSRALLLFFLGFFSFTVVSCGKSSKKDREESVLLRSYRLIDANKVDDAISLLSDELTRMDSNQEDGVDQSKDATDLRVALASAFAKKSGITIREIARSIDLGKSVSGLQVIQGRPTKVAEKGNERKLQAFAGWVLDYIRATQILLIVPRVEDSKVQYLSEAVKIISIPTNLSPGDRVYSALLKLILFKALTEKKEMGTILPELTQENGQCVAKMTEFRDHITRASKVLLSGINDVAIAMPEKKEEVLSAANRFSSWVGELISVSESAWSLQAVDLQFLKGLYTMVGLGSQKLGCELHVEDQ